MVDVLVDCGLFHSEDGLTAKQFYTRVRIPVQHGLPARLVEYHDEERWLVQGLFDHRMPVGSHAVEEIVEDNALRHVEQVVGIIERNYADVLE